jgi:hypothetical protein
VEWLIEAVCVMIEAVGVEWLIEAMCVMIEAGCGRYRLTHTVFCQWKRYTLRRRGKRQKQRRAQDHGE